MLNGSTTITKRIKILSPFCLPFPVFFFFILILHVCMHLQIGIYGATRSLGIHKHSTCVLIKKKHTREKLKKSCRFDRNITGSCQYSIDANLTEPHFSPSTVLVSLLREEFSQEKLLRKTVANFKSINYKDTEKILQIK